MATTDRITAAELRTGDIVGMHGDTRFTVEYVLHGDGYHNVVWVDTNEGQTYTYMGDESWPLISRAEASQPDSTLVAAIRQGIREGSTDETALDILVDALRDLAARWTETADAIRPDVDESFGYDSAQDERDDAIADTLDESVTGLLQIVGHADHPDLPLSLIQKLEA